VKRQREAVRLTKRVVDAAICPPSQQDMLLFDAVLIGFCVRVTRTGSKVFLLQYKRHGKVKRHRLGEYGALTVEQARKRAEEARGEVSGGGDPMGERVAADRAARDVAKADEFTVDAMLLAWQRLHLEPHRRPAYAQDSVRTLQRGLAKWLRTPARAMEAASLRSAIETIAAEKGHSAQVKAYRLAHAAFSWAYKSGRIPSNPLTNVARPPKEKAREQALSDREIGEVWRSCQQLGDPFGSFIRVLMLTLQRREEVAEMRWSELSADRTTWTLPGARTKNGRAHVVHLAPEVREILAKLPRFMGSDLVFTTTGKTGISGYSRAKARLDSLVSVARAAAAPAGGEKPAEMPGWRLHDLRRTGVTVMASKGVLSDVADRILNHVASATNHGIKGVYQVHDFAAERASALELWARHVTAVAAVDAEASGPGPADGPSRAGRRLRRRAV